MQSVNCQSMLPSARVLAEATCEKGSSLKEEAPFCFLQTPSCKRHSFCCAHCARYLGDLNAQILRAKGLLQRSAEFIANIRIRCGCSENCSKCDSIVLCRKKGCSFGYCSEACLNFDNRESGHWLVCTGGRREDTNLTRSFLSHASKTNDLFAAGLAVIAKLISTSIAISVHVRAEDATVKTIGIAVENLAEHILHRRKMIYTSLEGSIAGFEAQYPSKHPFWGPKSAVSVEASDECYETDRDSDGKRDRNGGGDSDSSRDRDRDRDSNCSSNRAAGIDCKRSRNCDKESISRKRNLNGIRDEKEIELNCSVEKVSRNDGDVLDVLEQQAYESWTLLQLLLTREKNINLSYESYNDCTLNDNDAKVAAFNAECIQHGDKSYSGLRAEATETMAAIMTFSRWSLLLGSLHNHLVPLQMDNPLCTIARSIPNLARWEDRKIIFHALNSFIQAKSEYEQDECGGADQILQCALTDIPPQSVSKTRCHASGCPTPKTALQSGVGLESISADQLAIERKIMRLAQAASLISSPSSSSSSGATNKQVGLSRLTDTENPFSSIAFLAMALVPTIGTNIGPCPCPNQGSQTDSGTAGVCTEKLTGIGIGHCEFVSHSCIPNAQLQTFMGPLGLRTRLVALRRVEKGSVILCSAIQHSCQVSSVYSSVLVQKSYHKSDSEMLSGAHPIHTLLFSYSHCTA